MTRYIDQIRISQSECLIYLVHTLCSHVHKRVLHTARDDWKFPFQSLPFHQLRSLENLQENVCISGDI